MTQQKSAFTYSASVEIPASESAISRALTKVVAIPRWNPAISRAENSGIAQPGTPYRIWIRHVIPGRLTYTRISGARIDYEMRALGNVESGVWHVAPGEPGAHTVTHEFTHSGWLLARMHAAFGPVALWRLQRLRTVLTR